MPAGMPPIRPEQLSADEWPKYHSEALMRAAINFQKSGRLAVSKQLFEQVGQRLSSSFGPYASNNSINHKYSS
jgi:hypothetical protein